MSVSTLHDLLDTLKNSLESATAILSDADTIHPIENGISLFDTKNELFLAYLQNLVFLILFKIRQVKEDFKNGQDHENSTRDQRQDKEDTWDRAVKKLVELRLYSEKGVKPLENRLRYEIDRVVQAAQDDASASATQTNGIKHKQKKEKSKDSTDYNSATDNSSSEDDEADGDEDESDGQATAAPRMPALRANLAALRIPGASNGVERKSSTLGTGDGADKMSDPVGVYRPPRIAPTSMPTTMPAERKARLRGAARSETMNEFLAEELSGAPQAMPSVGSNIERKGRSVTTAAQRREADERRAYEETNLRRLPTLSKKERKKQQQRQGMDGGAGGGGMKNGFGGEDWRDLGVGAERVIRDLDQRKKGRNALDKSRKRARDGLNDDFGIGAASSGRSSFEKRRKVLQRRAK